MRPRRSTTAWTLRIVGIFLIWPLFLRLFSGYFTEVAGLIAGIVLLFVASSFMSKGMEQEDDLFGRTIAASPTPYKLIATILTAAAACVVSLLSTFGGVGLSVVFGAIAALGTWMAYGTDPKIDRAAVAAAAEKAGMRSRDVVEAIEEANRKIAGIEAASNGLRSRELRERVGRITAQARVIMGMLEKQPRDLSRARRFLVTYLDGTRDVVAKYSEQQHDISDTELAGNFQRVLDTVEQVFKEQEEVLKRDDKLDLEVKIEVLETQLKREGVH